MARMSLDDMAIRDPRILVLARLCSIGRFEALGRLIPVWSACYDMVSDTLSPLMVDAAAEMDGFANHMIEAELAERDDSGLLRIRGAKQRIKYLKKKSNAGRKGGIKSGESRAESAKQKSKQTRSTSQAQSNPPAPVPDPASVLDNYTSAIAEFDSWYRQSHGGSKPTWDSVTGGMMKTLADKHGYPEIVKRIKQARASPPKWPAQPWDFKTFVAHFDKCTPSTQTSFPNGEKPRVVPKL